MSVYSILTVPKRLGIISAETSLRCRKGCLLHNLSLYLLLDHFKSELVALKCEYGFQSKIKMWTELIAASCQFSSFQSHSPIRTAQVVWTQNSTPVQERTHVSGYLVHKKFHIDMQNCNLITGIKFIVEKLTNQIKKESLTLPTFTKLDLNEQQRPHPGNVSQGWRNRNHAPLRIQMEHICQQDLCKKYWNPRNSSD